MARRVGQLQLRHVDILCKDNERIKVVHKKLLAKFGMEKAQVVYKEAIIIYSRIVNIIERQPANLVVRVVECQDNLTQTSRSLCQGQSW